MKPERISERNCRLDLGETPSAGSHIVSMRKGYSHHGIYIGNRKVVHYAGMSRRWARGPIEEVSLERFAAGRDVFVRPHSTPRFDRAEVVERARSRIGEASYRVFTNNCEHFCEWCVRGEPRSQQVESLKQAPRRLFRTLCAAFALDRWLPQDPPRGGWAA